MVEEPVQRKTHHAPPRPLGHAAQDYVLGRALRPSDLRPLAYAERRARVLEATTGQQKEIWKVLPEADAPAALRWLDVEK